MCFFYPKFESITGLRKYALDFAVDDMDKGTYFSTFVASFDISALSKRGLEIDDNYGSVASFYGGFQCWENGKTGVIMTIWNVLCEDAQGNQTIIKAKPLYVAEKAKILDREEGSAGEGDFQQFLMEYPWQVQNPYRMLIQMGKNEANGNATVTMQVCDLITREWTKMVTWDIGYPSESIRTNYMSGFLENYDVKYCGSVRSVNISNIHGLDAKRGEWVTPDSVKFTLNNAVDDFYYVGSYQVGADDSSYYAITSGVKNLCEPTDKDTFKVTKASLTYGEKELASVEETPAAKTLTYNGTAQKLVTAGKAIGGTMWYALGTDNNTAPISGWSEDILEGTDTGTYYVWFKAVGDSNYTASQPDCVQSVIGVTVTFDSAGGTKIEPQTVEKGQTISKPADPEKDGFSFDGWLHNDVGYDFSKPVLMNMTLTAKWKVANDYFFENGAGMDGAGGTWQKQSGMPLSFHILGRNSDPYYTFEELSVDGKGLEINTDFKKERGSLIISLQPTFLETLSVGRHNLLARFTDGGSVSTEFYITAPAAVKPGDLPQTGDDALHPAVYGILAALSLFLTVYVIRRKR